LDLKDQARPTLIPELVAVFGALLALSSRLALTRATPEEKDRLLTILSPETANSGHANTPTTYEQPLEQFAAALIDINNNLVLRLIDNGLRAQVMGRIDRNKPSPVDARSLLNNMANAIEADNPTRLAFVISEHFDHLSATLDAGEEPPTNPNASHRTTQHA
jgi:DNA-binding FadR family transcriptional regulator